MAGEVEKRIFECIDDGNNFIVDAGAGSGKTWSLVETLKYIIHSKEMEFTKLNKKIVCITYTNVAKNEIIERLEHNSIVVVSTIHDFLWSIIKNYQFEMKIQLLAIIDSKMDILRKDIDSTKNKTTKTYEGKVNKHIKYAYAHYELTEYTGKIVYSDRPYFNKGLISHDEIILLATYLVSQYEDLRKLITDSYPIILIDEYQDTQESVIQLLLDYLSPNKEALIGFFGDKMQKIYRTGVGEIDSKYSLVEIVKNQNYRCSQKVIGLLNKVRDDIEQVPTGANVAGECKFFLCKDSDFSKEVIASKMNMEMAELKVLYLTHNLLAKENGYTALYTFYNRYVDKDCLVSNATNRRCEYANFMFEIEELIDFYQNSDIQAILKRTSYSINSIEDKMKLAELIDKLISKRENMKIHDVIEMVLSNQVLRASTRFARVRDDSEMSKELKEEIKIIHYKEFMSLYKAQKNDSMFSTKHGTKGSEYKNVIAVIDDTSWNQYNFNEYFEKLDGGSDRVNRTRNLFYVIASRAIDKLAVVALTDLSEEAIESLEYLVGSDNVINFRLEDS